MTFVGQLGAPWGTKGDFSGHLWGPGRTMGDFCRSIGGSVGDNG